MVRMKPLTVEIRVERLEELVDLLCGLQEYNIAGDGRTFVERGEVISALNKFVSAEAIVHDSWKGARWIPCKTALPADGMEVYVTILGYDVIRVEKGETLREATERARNVRWVTRAFWNEDEQTWNDAMVGCPLSVEPIAWTPMPRFPEPYQGGEDELGKI